MGVEPCFPTSRFFSWRLRLNAERARQARIVTARRPNIHFSSTCKRQGRVAHTACVGVTERLGRASSRHPWRAILAWVGAIVVALVLAATLLPGNLTTEGHVTGSPESTRAERLFFSRFPPDKNAVDELVVVRSATLTARQPARQRRSCPAGSTRRTAAPPTSTPGSR